MTNAERKKRYIEKLKQSGKFEDFKKANAAKAKARRDSIIAGLEALPKNVREKTKRLERQYVRRQVAKHRQRKKEKNGQSSVEITESQSLPTSSVPVRPEDGSYKTTSAACKAVTKLKRAMPKTSQKKKEAVGKLLKSFSPADLHDILAMVNPNSKPKQTKGLRASEIDRVKAFYERDDISRMSPNVKDCRKFVDPITGNKEYKQLRFLTYKLADVYGMFVKHIQNGKSIN